MFPGSISRAVLAAATIALGTPAVAAAAYTQVPSPNAFAGNNLLNGISATSAADAWAVGSLCCSARHSGLGTLTEHWNGTAWSIVASPDSTLHDDVLNAVGSISSTDAWAVGSVKQTGFRTGTPLLLHWTGSSWSTVAPPAGLTGSLRAISADSRSDVWTTGDDGHGKAIVLRYNGTAWSPVSIPLVGTGETIGGVKAFSPSDVWLVGDHGSSTSSQAQTLILHWNGAAWSAIPSPSPDPNQNLLRAVGGVSTHDLWAVGQKGLSETATGVPPGTRTLALHWNGTNWATVSTPNLGDEDTLSAVAATASGSVTMVGSDNNTSGSIPIARTLVERWNGAAVAVQSSPNVGASDNLLQGVGALPGTSTVFAVGFHLQATGPYQTLILKGVGG
ncbi:MAG: hypothetical protein M3Z06_06450 [Actinomycetota bacterium]|nr:hypothetical protein [Actinomycetota bacterium]